MTLVDSHCHLDTLDLTKYKGSLDEALNVAKNLGVKYFLCAGIDLEESRQILDLAKKYTCVRTSVGLHPTEKTDLKIKASDIITIAKDPLVVGIGETGLDYYDRRNEISIAQKEIQKMRFHEHIIAAKELQKPLIIHSREASQETLQILKMNEAKNVGGVFHCFSYDWEVAKEVINLGFYIGIPGIVTFKNAKTLREVVAKLPLDKILLETDAPFLTPEPFRGKSNEPAYIYNIANYIANLKGISLDKLSAQTTANFFEIFELFPRNF